MQKNNFLSHSPFMPGLVLCHYQTLTYEIGLRCQRQCPGTIIYSHHIYNALQDGGFRRVSWTDMDIITHQGESSIYIGDGNGASPENPVV